MEGSNKLKLSYIARMMKADLTSSEFDFIMCLAMRQDNFGCISGVYYKDICSSIGISYQEFYNILYSLENKGLIRRGKAHYIDHEVTLTDNEFKSRDDFFEGYVHLTTMFTDKNFRKMKVGAKLIALDCYRIATTNKASYRKNYQDFIKDWKNILGVQDRSVKVYLSQLKIFFSVGVKEGILYVTPKSEAKNYTQTSESKNCVRRFVEAVCRRNKINYNENDKNVNNVGDLVTQYKTKTDNIIEKVAFCIKQSIDLINKGTAAKKDWIRELRPKFIHKLLKKQMGMDEDSDGSGITEEEFENFLQTNLI